jgi:phage minor structural protein
MIPILYEETETKFKTNGIGRLVDAISCTVTEERNGEYELEMEYPESGKLFKELKHSRIIGAVPSEDAAIQGFEIYKISKPINGVITVDARHVSYRLSYVPTLLDGTVVSSAQSALQMLFDRAMVSHPFSFTTDVTKAGTFDSDGLYSIRGMLAGTTGSVLQSFGGEYEFDNWRVILHSARGTKTDVVLDYGKNITDFKQEENIENTSTSVIAYWENSSSDSGVTRVVGDIQNSDNVNRFPYNRPLLLDCSQDYKDAPTKGQLNAKAQSYIKANNIGVPSVSIDVSFVALWQTEEYKDIAPLEKVHLCDTLTVRFSKLGVETTAKVIKTEYNVLMDRYNKISIGDTKYTLADTILNINDEIKQTSDKIATDMQNAIDHATRLINGGLGGYVVITPNETTGYPEEILIMDTPSKQTAKNVIRLNKNGIGFSLGNGYDGPFQSAWTIDGAFNANWITAGVLTAITIQTATTGKRVVIQSDDATVNGYDGNTLHSVIDLVSSWGGTLLLDTDKALAIRAPKLIISNVSQGDKEGTGTTAVTIDSPIVTKVDKNMGDSSHPTGELWVSGSDHGVYCTLPVYLNVTYGGSKIINGFVCGSATETIKTI